MCGSILCEDTTSHDHDAIEHLLDLAFGSGRHSKTSYRLREGNAAIAGLSLVTRDPGVGVSGTISFWPLAIGARQSPALLLGPLAVHPDRQGLGIGLALMREGLARAQALGHGLVLLVGDEATDNATAAAPLAVSGPASPAPTPFLGAPTAVK